MALRRPRRLAAAAARGQLSSILHEFAGVTEPSDSIGDRAVRLGVYNDDAAVLLPLADFEWALEMEEIVEDILLELTVAERLSKGPGKTSTVDEVARELGLEAELGLD